MAVGVPILIVAAFLIFIWMNAKKPKNFPPGPTKWPLIGSLSIFASRGDIQKALSRLPVKYGEVIGIYNFNTPIIVVSGLEGIREVFLRHDLSARPEDIHEKIYYGKMQGIVHNSGEDWKLQRRFTLQHLRDLGFGKSSLEGIAHEELQAVFDGIDELSGGSKEGFPYPVNFHDVLEAANINVLWHIMAGKRFDHKDPEFKQLIRTLHNVFQVVFQTKSLYHALPWVTKRFPRLTGYSSILSLFHHISNFLQDAIDHHKKTIDYDHPRDYMDIYLSEIKKQKNGLHDVFNEKQLKQVLIELFSAGSDTTLNVLSFAILYMILYPESQKKVQQELDEVVGKDRLPSLSDRARLPYVEATIQEVLRLSSVTPTTLPHTPVTTEEYITFRGYHIPKGSRVILNIYYLHHDPKLWKFPEQFIPERFLLKNEKGINSEAFLPFGAGKRACLGETSARNNIFLFFTGILQRYSLKVPDGQRKPSQEANGLGFLVPKPYTVKVQLRS